MKYKQKQGYGCGLYAVANGCNLGNFITMASTRWASLLYRCFVLQQLRKETS